MGIRYSTRLAIVLLIFLIDIPFLSIGSTGINSNLTQPVKPSQSDDLILHDKIFINGNIGFNDFPGLGTKDDPFIISGFLISAPISDDYDPISIHDSDVYFIIEDNFLTGNGVNNGYGIGLNNVENGLIRNNEIIDMTHGGFILHNSKKIIIEYNSIVDNNGHGLELQQSADVIIQHNTINSNNGDGIASYFSDNNIIFNNSLSLNSLNGIRIEESDSHILLENSLDFNGEGGIFLGAALFNIVESNMISNSHDGIAFQINGGELSESVNNTIISNVIVNNNFGITLLYGIGNTISRNLIDQNSFVGIVFDNGNNNYVRQNIISGGEGGFESRGLSYNNILTCNLFEEIRGYGVFIYLNPENELIYQNDFIDNQNEPQAGDGGISNTFDANYWSDIGNKDKNDDKINDIEYTLDGSANNADYASSAVRNVNPDDDEAICNLDPVIQLSETINQVRSVITSPFVDEPQLVLPISNLVLFSFIFVIAIITSAIILFRMRRYSKFGTKITDSPFVENEIGFDDYEAIGSKNRTPVSGFCINCGTYSQKNARFCSKCDTEFT